LNAANHGGHDDWRVPNVKELQSIVNYGFWGGGGHVSTEFHTNCSPGCTVQQCSCNVSSYYWSSSTFNFWGVERFAWNVDFDNGHVSDNIEANSTRGYVRAVRGGL
jgi:hypothetical protein